MQERNNKPVVIGGTGLVGSHLLYLLAQKGLVTATARNSKNHATVEKVFNYYNAESGTLWYRNIEWVDLDILDIDGIQEVISNAKEVYHCAALVSFHRIDFYRCIEFNRQGTANVVNACLQVPGLKLCYVSSTAALGKNPGGTINESCLWKATDKNSGYSVSKFGAEKEVWRGIEEGLNAVIINPCTVIGVGKWDEGSMEMFSTAKKGMPFYPSGANAIVDARDVASSMLFLMQSTLRSEKFLCTGSNQDFKTLFTLICQKMGKRGPKTYAPFCIALPFSYALETFSLVRGRRKGMTIESTRAAYSTRVYNPKKLKSLLPNTFYTIEQSIDNAIKGRIKT
jgi:nucleoside-diphosphate-sugar epimerase